MIESAERLYYITRFPTFVGRKLAEVRHSGTKNYHMRRILSYRIAHGPIPPSLECDAAHVYCTTRIQILTAVKMSSAWYVALVWR